LTTKDGEPMTAHVWSAMLTILVVVPIPDRKFNCGHAVVAAHELGHDHCWIKFNPARGT
jgi:hypothetical protein